MSEMIRFEFSDVHGIVMDGKFQTDLTWLDLAAMGYCAGNVTKIATDNFDALAEEAYDFAEALLAEKRKREAK